MTTGLLMREMPKSEKPRERLLNEGADAMRPSDLVAILLRTGTKGRSVLDIAAELMAKHKNLDSLSRAKPNDLMQIKGIGQDKAITLIAAFTLAKKMAAELGHESPLMDTPDKIAALLREDMRQLEVEQFKIVMLNARRRLIRVADASNGTLDTVMISPHLVFRPALEASAQAVVLAHNHPSGDPTPSEADIRATRDLIRAGQIMKIEVLDHIILGRQTEERPSGYVSLRELGYFY